MRAILILVFVFSFFTSNANSPWGEISFDELQAVYKKIGGFYENETYYITIHHTSYSDSVTQNASDNQVGFYFKDGLDFHMELFGTEVAQIKKNRITVVSESKEIIVTDAKQGDSFGALDQKNVQSKLTLKIERRVTSSYSEIKVSYNDFAPYSTVYMKIDAHGFIRKLILYFNQEVEWENESGELESAHPRIEIDYKLHPEKISEERVKLNAHNYVLKINSPQIAPSSSYINFSVSDLRFNLN